MLTVDLLNQNATLQDLPENVKQAIHELSKNDEEQVIGTRLKEVYTRFDAEIAAIVGYQKPGGVKTYDWNQNELTRLKGLADKQADTETKLNASEAKVADLEKQIQEGVGDAQLKGQIATLNKSLNDEKSLVTSLRAQLEKEQGEYEAELQKRDQQQHAGRVASLWTDAQVGMKFKDDKVIPADARKAVIAAKISELNAKYTADFGQGENDPVVFRDDKGEIVRNPNNNQNPFTANELLAGELKSILLENRKAGGAGGGGAGAGGGGTFALNGARNQQEAQDQIAKHLNDIGLVAGTPEFATKQAELTRESGVKELPLF